ncbi:MAG: hypothetical protein M3Q57_06845 [Pseudomonadota bacterium]|nr:hypothetical protein [Pseudomonadota bacterium]
MLASVGLGGDGDEVIAIENAFARFGVDVPVEDAAKWVTVGDVWLSLCRIIPRAPEQPDAFLRFCTALAYETGVDPLQINPESRLLV